MAANGSQDHVVSCRNQGDHFCVSPDVSPAMSRREMDTVPRYFRPLLWREQALGCMVLGRRVAVLLSSSGDEAGLQDVPASPLSGGGPWCQSRRLISLWL